MKKTFLLFLCVSFLLAPAEAGNVKGRVTADGAPLPGVWVSDGTVLVRTDEKGRFDFDSDKASGMVFIETPSGYVPDSRDGLRPDFWQYLNLPADREEVHDFQLIRENQDRYSVILCADLHLNNDPRKKDLAQFAAMVTPLARKIVSSSPGPVYTFHLGDFTQDIFWYVFGFNEAEGVRFLQDQRWPTLFYNVMGNHDHDGAVGGVEDVDRAAGWLWRDCWGPDRFSWNIGEEHWIFLDNIVYLNERRPGMIFGPNIWGSQNYRHDLRPEQLAWLEKDLEHVSPETRVVICCHAPVLINRDKQQKDVLSEGAMKVLRAQAERFTGGITVYSGHLHAFDFCEDASGIHQITIAATSGDQWKAPVGMNKAEGDGSPSGLMVLDFASGRQPESRFETFAGTFTPYRVYDLNVVGQAYRESGDYAALKKKFPERIDYSEQKWRNCLMVNYWMEQPGDRVEILEGGAALPELDCARIEDPVVTFQKDLPHVNSDQAYPNPPEGYYVKFHNIKGTPSIRKGHVFRSRTSRGRLTLRITGRDGKVRYEEELERPLAFDPFLKN